MPFLVRGKARARQYNTMPKSGPAPAIQTIVATPPPVTPPPVTPPPPPVPEPIQKIEEVPFLTEEEKISYQEVSYRVPKEERLLDLPLEEEVPGENYVIPEETTYNIMPVGNAVPIGVALKKKRKN